MTNKPWREGWRPVQWPTAFQGHFLAKGWRTAEDWDEVDYIESRQRRFESVEAMEKEMKQ